MVGDAHTAALNVASDLEQGGFEPAVFLAPGEADLERIAPGCDLILAWADATGVPPGRVIEMAGEGSFPPVVVCSEAFTEDEIVAFVRAGARDCVRRGDVARLRAAVARERGRAGVATGRRPRRRRRGGPLPRPHRGDPGAHLRGVGGRHRQPRLREPAAARDDGLLAGGVARRAGHVGAEASPGGPGEGAAAVPRRLRVGRALRLGVPGPRPRGAGAVVARRGAADAGARRRGALRAGLRPGHHGAEAGRGVAAEDAVLRPADRAAEPRAAPEPARPRPGRVREDEPPARPADPGPRPLPRGHEHARPPQRGPDRARAGGPPRGRARRRRPRPPAAGRRVRRAAPRRRRHVRPAGRRAHPRLARAAVHGAAAPDRGLGQRRDGGGPGPRDRGGDPPAPRGLGGAGGAQAGRRSERPLLVQLRAARPRAARPPRRAAPRARRQRAAAALPAEGGPQDPHGGGGGGAPAVGPPEAGLRVAGGVHPARGADRAHPPPHAVGARPRGGGGAGLGAGGAPASRWP